MNFNLGKALLSLLFYTNNPYFFTTFSKFVSLLFPYFSVDEHLKAWCLASLTADPGVASSIPAWSHTFAEIDHEIISTVILLPSAESFKKGCCQLQAKVCAGKVSLGELTVPP